MFDPMIRRRPGFRSGGSVHLADGQAWILPDSALMTDRDDAYDALLSAVVAADDRPELLRAELALGIHLIALNYDLSPLILGALLDFPAGDSALTQLQSELHNVAIEHVRAHRPADDEFIAPSPTLRITRRLGLFGRVRAAMSA